MATRWYTTERTTPENPRTQWRSPIRGAHGGQSAATLPVWVDAPTRTGRLQRAGPITLGRGARRLPADIVRKFGSTSTWRTSTPQ